MTRKLFKNGADASDDLANNRNQFIEFFHVPSGETVLFKAFISIFSDQYASDWNDEDVYGRNDPASIFKRTKRVITLGWDVVAGSEDEAKENLHKCSLLLSMLYPDYEAGDGGASLIKSSPLFKLKFMNLIQNVSSPGQNAKTGGLLGKLSGFTYEPDLEQGFYDSLSPTDRALITNYTGENLYPQTLKLQCEFTVLHQHPLGWSNGKPRGKFNKFPYADSSREAFIPGRVSVNDDTSAESRKRESLIDIITSKTQK